MLLLTQFGRYGAMMLAVAFEESKGSDEEASCSEGEQDDGMAVGGLGFWWGCGGVVQALGAALSMGEGWTKQRQSNQKHGEDGKKERPGY